MPDVVCFGELLVDMMSEQPGVSLENAFTFEKNAGGAPANVAAGCASLGVSAGLITKLGNDSFGRFLKNTIQEAGVDVSGVVMTDSYATQLAFVAISKYGVPDFEFHVKAPAHEQIAVHEVNAELIEQALVFHFGPLTLVNEPARSTTFAGVEMASAAGLVISFDANYRKSLWPDGDAAYELICQAAALSDIVKVNEAELALITGTDDPHKGLKALVAMGPELASVTLGAEGCAFANEIYYDEIAGIDVPAVVDTTGCGDAFVAASLVWLIKSDIDISDLTGEQTLQMYRHANAAGAFATMTSGAIASMPDSDDLDRMMQHIYG